MSDLHRALDEYLAIRRSLCFTLRLPASLLRSFVTFVERSGGTFITTDLALQWATHPRGVQPATWTWRLGIVRRFAAWRRATDARTEVPPEGLLPHRYRRKPPHLYRDQDVVQIIRAAGELPSPRGLRGLTHATLVGLLAVTGMRLSEGLQLDDDDVDLAHGVLVIRRTKFGKSRLVPVHPSTHDALRTYTAARDRLVPTRTTPAFFISERGTRLTEWTGKRWFVTVSREAGGETLAATAAAMREAKKRDVRSDPLVEAVLKRFPGAEIVAVTKPGAADAAPEPEAGDPDMPPDPEDER